MSEKKIVLQRSYQAELADVWALWATKEGFEAWWGPEGFRVEVHDFDLRVGGALSYDMIACTEETIAAMKNMGAPVSHGTHGKFAEVVPEERLRITHVIDFVPGIEPYEHDIQVELRAEGDTVHMVVTIDPHQSEELTRMATQGMESQLEKVPGILAREK